MNGCVVERSTLKGAVIIPPSKSQTMRALVFATLAHGKSQIRGFLSSPDTLAMVGASRAIGAEVSLSGSELHVQGIGGEIRPVETCINVGNSGLVLRFMGALAALAATPLTLTGDHSIRTNRPLGNLLEGLEQLGATVRPLGRPGYAPITIQGPLGPGKVMIAGEDSQPVSALLIAALCVRGIVELEVHHPGETPFVMMTLDWFKRLGLDVQRQGFTHYVLEGKQSIPAFTYTVPGDLSSAAFPIVAALVTGSSLAVNGVDLSDSQGDKKLFPLLEKMGAKLTYSNKCMWIEEGELRGIDVDLNDCIDAVPILAVLGCYAEGETRIRNVAVARRKECNRLQCVTRELRKLGGDVREVEDGLVIRHSPLQGGTVATENDHRMALALIVAGLGASGTVRVEGTDCMAKTYGDFIPQMQGIGAKIA